MSTAVMRALPSPSREFVNAFTANRGATVAFFVFAAVLLGVLLATLFARRWPRTTWCSSSATTG